MDVLRRLNGNDAHNSMTNTDSAIRWSLFVTAPPDGVFGRVRRG